MMNTNMQIKTTKKDLYILSQPDACCREYVCHIYVYHQVTYMLKSALLNHIMQDQFRYKCIFTDKLNIFLKLHKFRELSSLRCKPCQDNWQLQKQ